MAMHGTRFSEYRRGRFPALDWLPRWATTDPALVEGAAHDLPHRNALLGLGATAISAASWEAPAADAGHANQEILTRFRPLVFANNTFHPLVLRGGGTSSSLNGYRLIANITGGTYTLTKLVASANTILATVTKAFVAGGIYLARFRVSGLTPPYTLSASVWLDGDTEPGSWDTSVTDSSLADGWIGFHRLTDLGRTEFQYFAVGTNGDSAPSEDALPDPLAVWALEPDSEVEITAELEYRDTVNDTVGTLWASTHGRTTGPADYPPNVNGFLKLLNAGTSTVSLDGDRQFAGVATPTLEPIVLDNTPVPPETAGPLDVWRTYSFHGRPIILRAGQLGTDHRYFEPIEAARAALEPNVGLQEVKIDRAPLAQFLERELPVRRHVGITTGFEALGTAGWVSIPTNTAYERTDFVEMIRAYVPLTGVAGTSFSTISRRQTDGTHRQWHIALYQASHATLAHRLHFISDTSAGVNLIAPNPATLCNLGRFLDIILAIKGGDRWYIYIDGVRVDGGTITDSPTTAAGRITELNVSSSGLIVCDRRLEVWMEEEEALARFSAIFTPDAKNLAMHRCNDATGTQVTDYNALANHGTGQGTATVDWRWSPTYLGGPEVAGNPMPVTEGVVFHGPTVPIDSAREGFRFSDRGLTAGSTLDCRAKGLPLTPTTSFTNPVDGVVDVVGAADQPITVGLSATAGTENAAIHVPQLLSATLQARGIFSASTADLDSFLALRQLLPMRGGYHYDSPPPVAEFLANNLGALGSHSFTDSSGRIAAGHVLPPINPGPYGQEPLLEFLGYPNRGVTLAAHADYSLTQHADGWSLGCWVLFHRVIADPSVSSTFTYFPAGMTLIDRVSGATGYYLGVDGRDGYLIFGAPGITGSVTGLHFLRHQKPLKVGCWYWINAVQTSNGRLIEVVPEDSINDFQSTSEATAGSLVAASSAPIRIGHGPLGSLTGSIHTAIGFSHGIGSSQYLATILTSRPTATSFEDATREQRFHVPMTEGEGDVVEDIIHAGRLGRISGARWCPKLTIDLTAAAEAEFPGVRRSVPASQVKARYKPNHATISGADVVAGVSASDRIALAQPELAEEDNSKEIAEDYPSAQIIQVPPEGVPAVLGSQADADFIAGHIAARIAPDRQLTDIDGWRRDALVLLPTDEVLVKHPRFELEDGRPMRVVSLTRRLGKLLFDLIPWG